VCVCGRINVAGAGESMLVDDVKWLRRRSKIFLIFT